VPKLLLLPAQTTPADRALARRHAPRPVAKDYTVFRECLRWEFGFTCAICLLHEHDIMSYGEGWGVTQIEHIVPRSHDADLTGVYTNVLYVCRLCNGARSDTDLVDTAGRRLLDPTKDVWVEHFLVNEDKLLPNKGDRHAEYTAEVYGINEPRKVKLRRLRRNRAQDLWALISPRRADLTRRVGSAAHSDPAADIELARALSQSQDDLARLYRRLSQDVGTWIPDDAPTSCRCERAHARALPEPYLRQIVELEIP
jgi:hypothetical protein